MKTTLETLTKIERKMASLFSVEPFVIFLEASTGQLKVPSSGTFYGKKIPYPEES